MQKPGPRRAKILGGAAVVLAVLAGCVTEPAPEIIYAPLPASLTAPAGADASVMFWHALQGDHYENLPAAITALEAVENSQPNDPHVNMLLGMGYAWLYFGQYSPGAEEVQNQPGYPAMLSQAGSQAIRYLTRAQQLAPNDRILPGFLATAQFLQARENHDQAAEDAAYETLLANTKAYPQFQGFVQGWVLTAMYPADSPRFADGMDGYYASLDACVGFKVSRNDPSAPEWVFNILAKADPACYNTNIAPHNLQGTFLGLGDAFAKEGKLPQARAAYENVMRVPAYITWSYLHLLETRLEKLNQLQADFTATSGQPRVKPGAPAMFFQAYYSCTACHGV